MFTGFKTIAFGAAVATIPAILQYGAGIEWTQFGVSPEAGAAIGGGIAIFRWFTTTAIFTRAMSPKPADQGSEPAAQ